MEWRQFSYYAGGHKKSFSARVRSCGKSYVVLLHLILTERLCYLIKHIDLLFEVFLIQSMHEWKKDPIRATNVMAHHDNN